ncbi:zinc ribbon domain-containing protein [Bacillus sp. J14TS2]|uniref:zinc ribbon domain-containing protein n=1 Tax=Bacillus sp. J14TS2 TaxID=2807188 RepID=UPI001BB3AE5A
MKQTQKGLKVEGTEESYTSQSCSFCGGKHQAKGRGFICSVYQTEIHCDINGAVRPCLFSWKNAKRVTAIGLGRARFHEKAEKG